MEAELGGEKLCGQSTAVGKNSLYFVVPLLFSARVVSP